MTQSVKEPNIFSLAINAVKDLIRSTSRITSELAVGTEDLAKIYSETTRTARIVHIGYCAEVIHDLSAEELAYAAKRDPALMAPFQEDTKPAKRVTKSRAKKDPVVSEQ